MTESADRPSPRRANPQGPPQAVPPYPYPYPYPYRPGPYSGGYPPPPPQPHYGYRLPSVHPRNGLGVASLVLAIVALLSDWLSFPGIVLGLTLGVVAVVVGFLGRGRVKRGTANNGGVAIAGIVLGALSIIVGLALFAIWMTVLKEAGGGDYISCMQKAGRNRVLQQQCADQFRQNVEGRLSITLTPTPIP